MTGSQRDRSGPGMGHVPSASVLCEEVWKRQWAVAWGAMTEERGAERIAL
jgi:hypothetical protein